MNLPSPEDLQFVARILLVGTAIVAGLAWGMSRLDRRSARELEAELLAARYADTEAGETR